MKHPVCSNSLKPYIIALHAVFDDIRDGQHASLDATAVAAKSTTRMRIGLQAFFLFHVRKTLFYLSPHPLFLRIIKRERGLSPY